VRSVAARLGVARPRSAGRSAATAARRVITGRSPRTAWRWPRRPRPRPGKLAHDKPLRDFVQDKLKLHWSPEQICHALPSEFPGQRERHLVHETIYQARTGWMSSGSSGRFTLGSWVLVMEEGVLPMPGDP
jgi:IS30 family transposase